MACSIPSLFGLIRHRLGRIALAAVIVFAVCLGGVNLWAWYHFLAAETALGDEHFDEAQYHVSRCLHVWERCPKSHLLAARIDRAVGHYAEAERQLQECVRLQHGAVEETQLEAILLRAESGELREVEKGLWQCVNTGHPQSAGILETLARVYIKEARLGAALTALSRWIELEPGAARAWHWRGWVRESLMQTEDAVSDHQKAVELDPKRWGSRLRLLRLLLNQHKVEAARVHLDELLRGHGEDLNVQVAQAQVFLLQGKDEECRRLLDDLLQRHPHQFEVLYLRSRLASQQGPPHDAVEETFLRRGLSERPMDFRALHALYLCLKRQGRDKEAAQVSAQQKQIEEDVRRLNELTQNEVERAPYDADVLCGVGELLIRLGDEEKGLQWLHRALRENGKHSRSRQVLFRYYQSKGDATEAERHRQYLSGSANLSSSPSANEK